MSDPYYLARRWGDAAMSGVQIAAAVSFAFLAAAQAGTLRTQEIQLHKGWNAVFLEVFPGSNAPEVVFSNAPVSIVAAHFPLPNSVEFVTDPSRTDWRKE